MLPKYDKWFKSMNIVKVNYNYAAIILAYLVMVLIYPIFIQDSDQKKELKKAALIGATVFAIYAFTVASLFPKYGLDLAFTEIIWGTVLYTTTTYLTNLII
tara:strand:- start:4 stop:306 length:303 start_codon:yes stop_codon:yes gene_type:complete